ncbi:MAG TPA: alpha/beta hydrolase [Pyrinomonadaceae bacterium]|jgi:pimeloyl-ACP methyl ester carboxylesterase
MLVQKIMKKRYLVAGATGLAGAAVAAKLWRRPRALVWEEHAERVRHGAHSRFAEVGGVRVHYQEAGVEGAPPMILIHGFCASTLVWSDVLLTLAEMGFRVVAPDLVGFGFSGKPREGEYTIEAQARVVVGLMEHLGIERAALVGSSYGGAVAAVCALEWPERVERLVLVGAVTNDAAKRQLLLRVAGAPVLGEVLSPLLIDSRRLIKWRLRKIYANGNAHLLERARLDSQYLPLRYADTQRAILLTLRRWNASRIEREAASITQPTLLIWGEQDRDIPLRYGERLHAQMPNARLVVFRRCGHLPQEERPEEFAGLVAGFCKVVNRES